MPSAEAVISIARPVCAFEPHSWAHFVPVPWIPAQAKVPGFQRGARVRAATGVWTPNSDWL